jgi:hypothetical protein
VFGAWRTLRLFGASLSTLAACAWVAASRMLGLFRVRWPGAWVVSHALGLIRVGWGWFACVRFDLQGDPRLAGLSTKEKAKLRAAYAAVDNHVKVRPVTYRDSSAYTHPRSSSCSMCSHTVDPRSSYPSASPTVLSHLHNFSAAQTAVAPKRKSRHSHMHIKSHVIMPHAHHVARTSCHTQASYAHHVTRKLCRPQPPSILFAFLPS